ncbi:hypothetical protein ACFRAO_37390 [Streptomyces sp. NPDC056656]|uniref:hypothetical protein n=1 Tax=Streptomyces sp. NPDC056656 TaxID=3345895 RepID=UPI00367AFAA5
MKISLLGPPVIYGEGGITVRKSCIRTNLLVLLVSAGGRPVSDESLFGDLWPEAMPTDGSGQIGGR